MRSCRPGGVRGLYDSLWRYAEIVEFFRLCVASAVAVSIFVVVTLLLWWEERRVPISVYFLSAMFASSLTLYSRLTYRMYRNTTLKKRLKPPHAAHRCGRRGQHAAA